MIENNVEEKILKLLDKNSLDYKYITHEESFNCEMSANFRKLPLSFGLKTLFFKAKKDFFLFSIRAHLDVDNSRIRKILKSRKLRFATKEELWKFCQVLPGSLPPMGHIFNLKQYTDISVLEEETIAFNPGNKNSSIIIETNNFLTLCSAKYSSFQK